MQAPTDLSEPDVISLYSAARTNLVSFRHSLLNNDEVNEITPPKYHFEWSQKLLHSEKNQAVEGFRKSGKSQIILRAFPLYTLTFPNTNFDFIVLIKNNTDLAHAALIDLETEFETNPALNRRLVKVREQSGKVFSVDLFDDDNKVINVKIEAYGKGKSVRGLMHGDRTPKIVIIDDPQDKEDAKSETILESDWNWFLSDIKFLAKKCRIFLIGNNLGDKCIVERVINARAELDFEVSKVPVMIDGAPAWPEHDTVQEIEDEKAAYNKMGKLDIWLMEKMCVSTDEETRVFHEKDYRSFSTHHLERIATDCKVAARLDPASSKEKTACFRAIVVNAIDKDGNWFILDVPYGRWDPTELIDKIFDTVVKWNLKTFGIEKGILKDIFEHFIFKEMARRKVFFDIIPIEHAKEGSKLERIKMLAPRFKAHTIWFPDEAPWLSEMKSELAGVTKDGIKSLFIDLVDALAMHQQKEERPFGRTAASNLPRRGNSNARVL